MTDLNGGRWPGGTLLERLMMRVEKTEHGCWKWTGYHDPDGRPRFTIDNYPRFAYRLLYEQVVGPVPDELALDHLCQNPSCMNPEHLEPVTRAENTRRHFEQATHCRKGHELVEDNITRTKNGGWICKTCRRASRRRHEERKRAEGANV